MENSSVKRANQKDLADDIWFEIFLHLSLCAVFKFRCVSKVWFSILSSPNFILKWYKINNPLLPWSFVHIVYSQYQGLDDPTRSELQFAYPELHSKFMSDHQHGVSFRFFLDRDFYILGTSNGLVLCTTRLFYEKTYYVCNPLTQKWVVLPPPPPRSEKKRVVTGFVCNECFSESAIYKVIRIPRFEDAAKEFKIEIFSSDLGEWSIYDVSCPPNATWKSIIFDNYVTHNGVFYWLQHRTNKILAVSVNRNTNHGTCGNECRLINIPDLEMDDEYKHLNQCVGESEGLLCYARFKEKERSLSVWVLDGDWYMLHKDIKLHDWLAEIESQLIGESEDEDWIREIAVEGFSPVDKDVVILSYEEYVWAYNTKTRVYEQLCHPSFPRSNLTFVPHTITFKFVLKSRPTILPPVS